MKIDIDNITAVKQAVPGFDQSYTVKARVDDKPMHMVISVDWEALAAMLGRACLTNITRKSRMASGNIRAWVKP